LPHHLVASFRATLEEAIHADVLLIVIDVSDPMASLHFDVVQETLDSIFGKEPVEVVEELNGWLRDETKAVAASEAAQAPGDRPQVVLVLNKADKCTDNGELAVWAQRHPDAITTSAVTGRGLEELRERIRTMLAGTVSEYVAIVPFAAAKALSDLESRGEVLERAYTETGTQLRVRLGALQVDRLRSMGVAFSAVV
jgi:GTP-binding protein HflX